MTASDRKRNMMTYLFISKPHLQTHDLFVRAKNINVCTGKIKFKARFISHAQTGKLQKSVKLLKLRTNDKLNSQSHRLTPDFSTVLFIQRFKKHTRLQVCLQVLPVNPRLICSVFVSQFCLPGFCRNICEPADVQPANTEDITCIQVHLTSVRSLTPSLEGSLATR